MPEHKDTKTDQTSSGDIAAANARIAQLEAELAKANAEPKVKAVKVEWPTELPVKDKPYAPQPATVAHSLASAEAQRAEIAKRLKK